MSDYNQIIKDIQNQRYAPVYFLHGEETFFIDNITEHIEKHVLDDAQKSFNQYILYGKDVDFSQIVSTAKKYPMMGERQVVVVKEAQEIKDWKTEKGVELLVNYVQNPLASTILLFAYKYKSLDKRKKSHKALLQESVSFESKKIYDDQIPGWIQSYAQARGAKISVKAVHLLAENIGNNLQRLSNEIEKLLLNVPTEKEIDDLAVHRHVGISKDYNVFELQKAISLGNFEKSLKIVKYFAANPNNHPLVMTIGSLYSYFSKLLLLHYKRASNDYEVSQVLGLPKRFAMEYTSALKKYHLRKVIEAIQYLHEVDLRSKGIGYNMSRDKEGELLKEFIYKVMRYES